ncbi:efflux RND transporter permease subunit [Thiocystis violascens]|uniref:Cation/multidrug efflux pump n=1 Tax=Thiocystis violascens (strain ATCC 17096 / DSM 198 / 6111) TaxID=765911 RepID=I3Y8T7_THIV6|nr:efflux RND transporter permease subunit [Thiocystis violascens]AFL73405.1 cation/multidrug efflux pump [Thiocystis violascens DSM 198]
MSGFNLSDWAIRNRSVTIFIMLAVLAAGVSSFYKLGRAEDPPFTFRTMVVKAIWPGATLDETIAQVTERLERTLQEVPNLDNLRSFTRAGTATIFVDLVGSTQGREVSDTWYEVRKKVGDMRHTLPQGIVGPFFNDEFGDTFGIIYAFTADGFTHRELRDAVEDARSQLLTVPDVSKIDILGAQDEVIYIDFSVERLAGLGFDPSTLIAALRAQNIVSPAGILSTSDESIALRVSGAFGSERDIAEVTFAVGERMLRLRDIADVRRGFVDPPQPMFRVNGEPAIGLAIAMRDGGDTLALGRNVAKAIADIKAELPLGIEPRLVADQPLTVDLAINEFTTSLWQAIGIVLVISFVALGARAGTVVAIAIPLTLAVVFPMMDIADIDLQRVSLGALIIALALMVDDAMTTIDAMSRRLALGDDKASAAVYAYKHLSMAMLIGTLVTIAGFVPIGFAQSSAGEYTFSIFAVVGIALIASWLVAMVFAPLIGMTLLRPPKAGANDKPSRTVETYRSFLTLAMRARWFTIALTLAIFVAAILALGQVPRQFFPSSDRPELLVDLQLPQNASIHATERLVNEFEQVLRDDPEFAPEIERWSTYIGQGAIRFYLPLNVQLANPFFAQSVIVTKDIEARERLQPQLEQLLAERFPEVVGRVSPLELGPPVGWPLQYRVMGPDPTELRDIALQLADLVADHPGSRRVNFDWMEPERELHIRIDQEQARQLGLSTQAVSTALNANISGTGITQVRDDIYLVNVVARELGGQSLSVETLRSLPVSLPNGRTIPLSQFAVFEYGQDYPLVWRRDRIPTLTVQADVTPGMLPETVVADLEHPIAELNATLPAGYRIELGGAVEESTESQASVFAVVPLMILLMLTLLIFQLKSFARLFMVLSLVPLGLIGVVGALLVSGKPLGFVAILGILALIGMIAKNAVILIDQIEAERAAGKSVWDAVVEASLSRFRPIMLTALSTILGMIPIAPTVFWGSMAFAIMGGLAVASLLTLVFLPTLYVTWFGGVAPRRDQTGLESQTSGA